MRNVITRIIRLLGAAVPAILLAAVLVGGCGPRPTVTAIHCDRQSSGDGALVNLDPGGTLIVGPTPFKFIFRLDPVPGASWAKRHVSVEPAGASYTVEVSPDGDLAVGFESGPPGELVTVTLTGVSTSSHNGKVSLTATRAARPTVSLEVKVGGEWRPVRPAECLPAVPLDLRLVFSEDMDRPSVEAGLSNADSWNDEPNFVDLRWVDDRTILLRAPERPGAIRICVEAKTASGLALWSVLPTLFNCDPPRLCAYDPRQGTVRDFSEVPVNIFDASISPDGKSLYVESMEQETEDLAYWTVDVATGAAEACEPRASEPDDAGVWAAIEEVLQDYAYGVVSFSPDGTRAAALAAADGEIVWDEEHGLSDLYVVDADTGTCRLLASDFADRWYPMHGVGTSDPSQPLWSPDGTRIALLSDGGPQAAELKVYDLSTAKGETVAALKSGWSWSRFTWSPDGRFWTVDDMIVSAAPPYALQTPDFRGCDRPRWSPDGHWFARGYEWGRVEVRDMQEGTEFPLETALACGWDETGLFYFVRWAAGWERYVADWECD